MTSVGTYTPTSAQDQTVKLITSKLMNQLYPNTYGQPKISYTILSSSKQVVNGINYKIVLLLTGGINSGQYIEFVVNVPPLKSSGQQLPPTLMSYETYSYNPATWNPSTGTIGAPYGSDPSTYTPSQYGQTSPGLGSNQPPPGSNSSTYTPSQYGQTSPGLGSNQPPPGSNSSTYTPNGQTSPGLGSTQTYPYN